MKLSLSSAKDAFYRVSDLQKFASAVTNVAKTHGKEAVSSFIQTGNTPA